MAFQMKARHVAGFFAMAVVSLLFAEVMLQALAWALPGVDRLVSPREFVVKDARLGHRPSPRNPDHDFRGFRNAAVPREAFVVALGDSQTYGTGVSREQAWPQQVRVMSGLVTYNMAFGGYGPGHSVVLLDEALGLKPKVIIEAFYAGNDLYDTYSFVYNEGRLIALRSSDRRTLNAIAEADSQRPLTPEIAQHFQSLFGPAVTENDPARRAGLKTYLSESSRLYGMLRAVKRSLSRRGRGPSILRTEDWESITRQARKLDQYVQVYETERVKTVFTSDYRLLGNSLDDPRIAEGFRMAMDAMVLMRDRCRDAGVAFQVLLLPTKEFAFGEVANNAFVQANPAYGRLLQNEALLWSKTREVLSERGVEVLDAVPRLRESLRNGKQLYHMTVDGHPNPAGHQAIAVFVLEELAKRGLVRQ